MDSMEVVERSPVVSFDDEPLILVDEQDRELGFLDKAAAHKGSGVLHRAFSVFVFNSDGEMLLQQRALGKRLWGGYWSNACCSHPRRGETVDAASVRRLGEELGLNCPLQYLFKFEYQAQFDDDGAEHELCWVYAGRSDQGPRANVNEIAAFRYLAPAALDEEMAANPAAFTPWFKIEWARIQRNHPHIFTAKR